MYGDEKANTSKRTLAFFTPGTILQLLEAHALRFSRLIGHPFATAPLGRVEIAISRGAVRRDDSKKTSTGRTLLCNQTVLSETVPPETVGPRQQHPALLPRKGRRTV